MKKEKGCVYFFRHVGLSPIKIGYSENESPIDRFNTFKTYAPFGSEIIGFIRHSDAKQLETELHQKYSRDRLKGEWFEITVDEVNKCIDFYSNLEDIEEANNFQVQFAKMLKYKNQTIIHGEKQIYNKDDFESYYLANENVSITNLAKTFAVTRVTIYKWIENVKIKNKFDIDL